MTNEELTMSNEEAIEVLKNDIEICTIQQKQACDMAIKALEQTDKIEESNFGTEQYKADLQGAYDCGYNCGYADAMNDISESDEAVQEAVKDIKQNFIPKDVLDKIIAEIMKLQTYKMFEGEKTVYVEREDVLKIIDKYKVENEESEE